MLHHLSFAVSELDRSAAFYDAVLRPLGYERVWTVADAVGYGVAGGGDKFAIKAASGPLGGVDPGLHLAFVAKDWASVDAFYAAAMAQGAKDNGAPGLCPEYGEGYYAAFVFDPDGYPLEAVIIGTDASEA